MRMEEKRTQFRIKMRDKFDGEPDYDILLHTTEPKSDEEILSLIDYWAEVNAHNTEFYSPVDIMDDICDNYDGWWWEDGDREDIYIKEW